MNLSQSLCWECQNAVPNREKGTGCPWSISFQPVPGWDAVRRDIKMGTGVGEKCNHPCVSYFVKGCPLFVKDAEPVKSTAWADSEPRKRRTRNCHGAATFPDGKRILYSIWNLTDGIYFDTIRDAAEWCIETELVKHNDGKVPTAISLTRYFQLKNRESKGLTFEYGKKSWKVITHTSKGEIRFEH